MSERAPQGRDPRAPASGTPLTPERPPASSIPASPSSPTAAPPLPLALRLIGRSSLPGAVFLIGVAATFVFGLPLLAERLATDEPATTAATTLSIDAPGSGTVHVTLAGDWAEQSRHDGAMTLTNAGATLSIVAPQPVAATGTPRQVIDRAVAQFTADLDAAWVASDPIEITTDAGDSGLCVTGSTVSDMAMTCAIEHGDVVSTLTATASTQVWPSLQSGVDTMLASITFTDPGSGSGQP